MSTDITSRVLQKVLVIIRKFRFDAVVLVVLFLLLTGNGLGQKKPVNEHFRVDSIYITGNKSTKEFIIFRELTFAPGDTVNRSILQYNRERIYSLGIFNTVELLRESSGNSNSVNIFVEEGWYLWPIPFIDFKDNDLKKISAGMDLRLENFQGINDDLRLKFALGYDPEVTLTYLLPYIWTDPDISFESITTYGTYKNNDLAYEIYYGDEFEYKTIKQRFGLGYRLSLYSRVIYYPEFIYSELPAELAPISAGNTTLYRLISNSVKYWYDSRDLKQFPKNGTSLGIEYAFKKATKGDIRYSNLIIDYRTYDKLFAGINYRYRLYTKQSIGNIIPSFDLAYIGYADYIRGNFNEKIQGKNSYLTSLEFTKDLITEWIINYDFPVIPSSMQTFRTALMLEAFFDAGTTANSNSEITKSRFQSGIGVGIVFLVLPYDVLRIEYGFNNRMKAEFKIDLGLSF